MTGIELILSTVCNVTLCETDFMPPMSLIGFSTVSEESNIKALRKMVQGKHFRVGSFDDGLRSKIKIDEDGKVVGTGIAFIILNEISDRLKFTYEVVLPPTHLQQSDRSEMENWLVGMLLNNKIDIAVAFITFTMKRKDLIKFSIEINTVNTLLENESLKLHELFSDDGELGKLQPFDIIIWCDFFLTLTLFTACLVLMTRLRSKLINDDEESFTISSSLSHVYRVMTKQNVRQKPKATMTRILLITWSLFMILMSICYGAYLSLGYTLAAVSKNDAMIKKLFSADPMFDSLDNGHPSCNSIVPKKQLLKRPSGFAYPGNSTLYNLFNYEIRELYYNGMLQVVSNKAWDANAICSKATFFDAYQVQLEDLAYAYYCLFAAALAAFAVFILELFFKRHMEVKEALETQTQSEQEDTIELVVHRESATPFCSSEVPRQPSSPFHRTIVNGRRYLLARTQDRAIRLVPIDTLSAVLYDLDLYEKV